MGLAQLFAKPKSISDNLEFRVNGIRHLNTQLTIYRNLKLITIVLI